MDIFYSPRLVWGNPAYYLYDFCQLISRVAYCKAKFPWELIIETAFPGLLIAGC